MDDCQFHADFETRDAKRCHARPQSDHFHVVHAPDEQHDKLNDGETLDAVRPKKPTPSIQLYCDHVSQKAEVGSSR